MTKKQARAAVESVKANLESARQKLTEIHRRRGWQSLGYRSWKEFGEAEFKGCNRSLYYLMETAQIEANLIQSGVDPCKIFHIPDSHLRQIGKTPVTLLKPAFEKLLEFQEAGKTTAEDATAAVESVYPNAAYKKIQHICNDAISSGFRVPAENAADSLFQFLEKKGKPLSSHRKAILREGIEDFLGDFAEENVDEEAAISIDEVTKKASEVASFLNSFEPKVVASGLNRMDEEYAITLLKHLEKLPEKEPLNFEDGDNLQVYLEDFTPNEVVAVLKRLSPRYLKKIAEVDWSQLLEKEKVLV